jgi:protein-L-isoaspartate(D-aspartate) O-methyltransferase
MADADLAERRRARERERMVREHVEARGVRDPRLLQALREVPRHRFVREHLERKAYGDFALPIEAGQTISQPYVVARMCELLELRGDETVLDVGTGSGYHAAVLARLAERVVSIERLPSLSHRAGEALRAAGVRNVRLVVGDGSTGYAEDAPYDAINVAAGSAHGVPPALEEQLADGGRMVLPINGRTQRLLVVRRRGGTLAHEEHDPVRFVPLVARGARER